MKLKRKYAFWMMMFFLSVFKCFDANAFQCNNFNSVSRKDITQCMGVFLGEVVSVDKDSSRGYMKKYRAVFKIKKSWKGANKDIVEIYNFSSFDDDVTVGNNCLVFTSMFVDTKEYSSNNCSIIKITSDMEAELLDKLGDPDREI